MCADRVRSQLDTSVESITKLSAWALVWEARLWIRVTHIPNTASSQRRYWTTRRQNVQQEANACEMRPQDAVRKECFRTRRRKSTKNVFMSKKPMIWEHCDRYSNRTERRWNSRATASVNFLKTVFSFFFGQGSREIFSAHSSGALRAKQHFFSFSLSLCTSSKKWCEQ